MTPYVLSLIAASLAAAVVELLAPRGDGGRIAGHVRAVAGLFLLVALLSPLRAGLGLLSDIASGDSLSDHLDAYLPTVAPTEHESTLHATLTSLCAAEAEGWVKATLESRFSVPPADCTVALTCNVSEGKDAIIPAELRIALSGASALADPHPIEDYFSAALACPCYVTVDLIP